MHCSVFNQNVRSWCTRRAHDVWKTALKLAHSTVTQTSLTPQRQSNEAWHLFPWIVTFISFSLEDERVLTPTTGPADPIGASYSRSLRKWQAPEVQSPRFFHPMFFVMRPKRQHIARPLFITCTWDNSNTYPFMGFLLEARINLTCG